MISQVIYALRYPLEHPVQSLAATAVFGFSKNQAVVNVRFAMARISYYMAERALFDAGNMGKMLYEDLKVKKGQTRPPIWKGSQGQQALNAGRRTALARIAPVATQGGRMLAFLVATPVRTYLTATTLYVGAGYAVGRTHGARTAPAIIQSRYVMGSPI